MRGTYGTAALKHASARPEPNRGGRYAHVQVHVHVHVRVLVLADAAWRSGRTRFFCPPEMPRFDASPTRRSLTRRISRALSTCTTCSTFSRFDESLGSRSTAL